MLDHSDQQCCNHYLKFFSSQISYRSLLSDDCNFAMFVTFYVSLLLGFASDPKNLLFIKRTATFKSSFS